ncbi:hypothetical protein EDB86DRAFT_3179133 [Lactarius hatsudake]|nr:hypothetical protein EDB86DRAFT_3179133 [Lactarius hatsudake]
MSTRLAQMKVPTGKLAVDNTGLLCLPLHVATVICNWLHVIHNLKVMLLLHVTTLALSLATTLPCSRSLHAAFPSNLGVQFQMSSDKVSHTHSNLATQALIRVDLSMQQVQGSGSIEQDEIGIVWVICFKKTLETAAEDDLLYVMKSGRKSASSAIPSSYYEHSAESGVYAMAMDCGNLYDSHHSNFTVRAFHGQNLIIYGDNSQTHSTTSVTETGRR